MISCRLYVKELEIIKCANDGYVDQVRDILIDDSVPFEEDNDSFLISGIDNILRGMLILSGYYTLLVD